MKKLKFCMLFFLIFIVSCSPNDSNNNSEVEIEKSGENINGIEQEIESSSVDNITEKVKEYIINGQENKTEAEKIKWSKIFLDQVDIEGLYKQYIVDGGDDDLESFAKYMTLNAPIPDNWEELVKKEIYDIYGERAIRFEKLEGELYQVYVEKDGSEIPYFVVSSRTGYFHG